jgi:hypothetical protein
MSANKGDFTSMKKTVRFFFLFACVFALIGILSGVQAKAEKPQGIQLCCDAEWEYVGK